MAGALETASPWVSGVYIEGIRKSLAGGRSWGVWGDLEGRGPK